MSETQPDEIESKEVFETKHDATRSRQLALLVLIFTMAIGAFLYRWLVLERLEQTAALFIGLPMLISIALTFTPTSKTVTGMLVKGTLLFLAMSGILLGEGIICIAMAAPLFLMIAVIIGLLVDASKRKNQTRLSLSLAFVLMAMEGVFPGTTFSNQESVEVSRTYPGTINVAEKLALPIEFHADLPTFFKAGFPLPQNIRGQGSEVGDTRCIYFAGGEGNAGDLCLKISESSQNRVVYEFTKDESHISHWLTWQKATIDWEHKNGETKITWTSNYQRDLSPAWYFGPAERFGVKLSSNYLLDSYFGKDSSSGYRP